MRQKAGNVYEELLGPGWCLCLRVLGKLMACWYTQVWKSWMLLLNLTPYQVLDTADSTHSAGRISFCQLLIIWGQILDAYIKQNFFTPADVYSTSINWSFSNTFLVSGVDENICLLGGRGDLYIYIFIWLYFRCRQISFPGVKRPKCDVDHSNLSSAKVKAEWIYAPNPHTCLQGADRDNFIFFIW